MLRRAPILFIATLTACVRPDARKIEPAPPQDVMSQPAASAASEHQDQAPDAAAILAALPANDQPASITEAPAPMPSGMDLLYSDRVPILASGEPMVAIGIASGRERVITRARGSMTVDFYEGDIFKRATVTPGTEVTVTIRRVKPATRSFNIDLEGVPYEAKRELDQVVAKWTARDIGEVHVIEEGSAIGLSGRLIDNREWRLWLAAKSKQDANQRAQQIAQKYSERVSVSARLAEKPWAELDVRVGEMLIGMAVSYVRFTAAEADGAVEIPQVEYAKGYSWEGKENRAYVGEIYAVVDPDGKLATVNALGAEKVLEGVVPSEMFASAPLEALKSQAVAARNQLFAKLGKRHHDDPFHLCSEQHCQVYSGLNKRDQRATAAIDATSGQVLFRDGRLVDTVYSSTCGGHTEDNDVVWGNVADPALRGRPDFDPTPGSMLSNFIRGVRDGNLLSWLGVKDDTYCARASQARADKFRWERSFDGGDLQRLIGSVHPEIGQVKDIDIDGRGPGGRVTSVTLIGDNGHAKVAFEYPVRRLFDNLSSGAFALDVVHDDHGHISRATFRGAGWGHGVGMCQMGAIGRAESGQSYNRILGHYYNGAEPVQVYGVRVPPRADKLAGGGVPW